MIIIKGEARFPAGEVQRMHPMMQRAIMAARSEPGCADCSFAVDLIDPNLIHVSSLWSDQSALDRHMNCTSMRDLEEEFERAGVESVRIDAYDGHFVRTLLGEATAAGD